MKEESIVAQKIIKDHMLASSLEPRTTLITNSLIMSSLEKVAASKKATEISNQEAIFLSKINDVSSKRDELRKTCVLLDEDFVSSVKEAENKNDTSLIHKANVLKR